MPFSNEIRAGASGAQSTSLYGHEINQSLRFEDGDSPALSKTFSAAQTNTKILTISVWVKRANLGIRSTIIFAKSGSSAYLHFNTSDKLVFNAYNTGYTSFTSDQVFRDTSAWYHIVAQADSQDQTGANIHKVYVNGELITGTTSGSFVADDTATMLLRNGVTTYIGDDTDGAYHFDGYLAEMHVIDGSVVAHTEFGETKDGVWIPKAYSGSYGTNGFHLPFEQDVVSGFSGNFDDDDSDSITFTDATAYDIGSSDDFTVEFFIKYPAVGGSGTAYYGDIAGNYATSGPHFLVSLNVQSTDRDLYIYYGNGQAYYWSIDVQGLTLDAGVWHHMVIQRDGGLLRSWFNGTRVTNANAGTDGKISNTTAYDLSKFVLGVVYAGGTGIGAKLSNFRLVIGGTVYADSDSDITVPTSTLTNVTNTKLLALTSSDVTEDISSENNTGVNSGVLSDNDSPFTTKTLGDDASGRGNNFTISGLSYIDVMADSPTNNFCTLNPNAYSGIGTFSEGNLTITTSTNNRGIHGTFSLPPSGKWYYEVHVDSYQSGGGTYLGWGTDASLGYDEAASSKGIFFSGYNEQVLLDGSGQSGGYGITSTNVVNNGDIYSILLDVDGGLFYYAKNGTYFNSADPAAGSGGLDVSATLAAANTRVTPCITRGGSYNETYSVNFGQDTKDVASANADENGNGTFEYSVPSGFLALCAKSLTDPELGPNKSEQATDHYQTALYEGTGSSQNVTGVGFKPDWIWVKRRDGTQEPSVTDSVRGTGKQLRPAATAIESSETDCITSFDSDGFTLGADASGNNSYNYYTDSHVAWCWKAGGAPTATNSAGAGNVPTAGSVMIDGVASTSSLAGTNPANKISANTKAGFSIVSFTGTGSNATVAHGLTKAPDVCIVKERSPGTGNWFVYSRAENDQPSDGAHVGYFNISTSAFTESDIIFNDTPPTDTVFHLGTGNSNKSSDELIAYLFHEVEGFSKFGIFSGNSNADGTFVYCGFKPARIWLRQDATGIDWTSYDLKRLGYNVDNNSLRDKTSGQEQTDDDLDILSNGFKCRRNFANNQGDVLFFAWADSPVKYSNAR